MGQITVKLQKTVVSNGTYQPASFLLRLFSSRLIEFNFSRGKRARNFSQSSYRCSIGSLIVSGFILNHHAQLFQVCFSGLVGFELQPFIVEPVILFFCQLLCHLIGNLACMVKYISVIEAEKTVEFAYPVSHICIVMRRMA